MSDDSPVVKATLGERARVLELIRSRRDWKPRDISELIRWIESGAELEMPPLPIVTKSDDSLDVKTMIEDLDRVIEEIDGIPGIKEAADRRANQGRQVGELKRIIKQRLIEGRPVDSDVAVHAAILVSNGWPAVDALEESKRTLDDAEREGGY